MLASALVPAPYTDHHITIDGFKLHYQDYGSAGKPPMLCIHGGAANGHWFDFVAAGFTANFHVRALDMRGHGDSDWDNSATPDYSYERYAADVNEFAEKLGLRDFVLIGHSMGGMISTVYCGSSSKYPCRARAFLLVDTTIKMSDERIAGFHAVGAREGRHYADQAEFIAHYKVRPGDSTAAPEILRHMAFHSGRQFPDGRWRHKVDRRVYANRVFVDSYAYWANVKIPSLLMRASRSGRITPEMIAKVQSRAPQVLVSDVADSDHHITLDNPAGFIQAANEYLNKIK